MFCFFPFLGSIGSLGKDLKEEGVQNVTVTTATFTGTQNGVRIKSWARASNGFARDVRFQHIAMVNVQNPIFIDQNYCPNKNNCPDQVRVLPKIHLKKPITVFGPLGPMSNSRFAASPSPIHSHEM